MPDCTRILLTVEAEPPTFHEPQATFAVHLGFEAELAEAEAKAAFAAFLAGLATLEFHVYRYSDPAGTSTAVLVGPVSATVRPGTSTDVRHLADWLAKSGRPYASPGTTASEETTVELEKESGVTASHLLLSTAGWEAPVPHAFGLTAIVHIETGGVPFGELFLVPWAGDPPDELNIAVPADPANPDPGFEIELTPATGGAPAHLLRTRALSKPDDPGGLTEVSGFLHADPEAADINRVLTLFEQASPAQSWLMPWLIDHADGVSKGWAVRLAVVTALDPILIALTMPGYPEHTEGQLLSGYVSCFRAEVARYAGLTGGDADIQAALSLLKNTEIVKALKSVLLAHPLVQGAAADDVIALALDVLGLKSDDPLRLAAHQQDGSGHTDIQRRLRELMLSLESEAGAEAAVLRLLNSIVTGDDAASFAARLVDGMPKIPDRPAALAAVAGLAGKAFAAFETMLLGDYNGAEAIRRSIGQVWASGLAKVLAGISTPRLGALKSALEADNFLSSRAALEAAPAISIFGGALAILTKPGQGASAEALALLQQSVTRGWKAFIGELFADVDDPTAFSATGGKKRFIPDQKPLPLPIRIATDIDEGELDTFNSRFNGIGVLVARDGRWTHASLGALATADGNVKFADDAICPYVPVVTDGRRELFIDYRGFPLASPAFSGVHNPTLDSDGAVNIAPLYDVMDVLDNAEASTKPPALAYGKTYRIASYVVTKAGSLPRSLQGTQKPWLPRLDLDGFAPPETCLYETAYLRRTAIGALGLSSASSDLRVGRKYPDVSPLTEDYPRVAAVAYADGFGVIDLLRNSDGSGSLELPPKTSLTLQLKEMEAWGADVSVSVIVMTDPTSELPDKAPSGGAGVDIRPGQRQDKTIRVTTKDQAIVPEPSVIDVQVDPDTAFWLRLYLRSASGADLVGISLAQVEPSSSRPLRGVQKAPPLLLLGDGSDIWTVDFKKPAALEIDLPRVAFMDFEHWINNDGLLARHIADPKQRQRFRSILLHAYVLRALDPRIADLIEKLPDLSVEAYLVELAPSDRLADVALKPVREVVAHRPLADTMANAKPHETAADIDAWKLADYLAFLTTLDGALRRPISVGCEGEVLKIVGKDAGSITVPAGVTAQLSIKPLVPAAHFQSGGAFDPRLRQYAVGHVTAHALSTEALLAFEGASLLIETMSNGLPSIKKTANRQTYLEVSPAERQAVDDFSEIAKKYVVAQPSGSARSYQVLADPQRELDAGGMEGQRRLRRWKHVGSVELHSQRWRFSGRPIYNWLSPIDFPQDAVSPVIPLPVGGGVADKKGVSLAQFEAEAFFGRDSADHELSVVRLQPLGARSMLQQIMCEAAATYWRHRLVFLSRYRGAMKKGVQRLEDWSLGKLELSAEESKPFAAWSRRVAVLAEPLQGHLTRPPVRAIMPISARPETDGDDHKAPPLACLIEERPFAIGGLAGRIAAGVGVDLAYRIEQLQTLIQAGVAQEIAAPHDIGRQAGKDPRMTLRPGSARGATFGVEGPVGLTFDQPSVSAPAWSNCQYLLTAESLLQDEELGEETFLGISLQRYLDPAWVFQPEPSDGPIDASQGWWAEFAAGGALGLDTSAAEIATVSLSAAEWTVTIDSRYLDDKAPQGNLELCKADTVRVERLVLAHTPLGEGQALLSVLAVENHGESADGRILAGISTQPKLLAGIRWNLPKDDGGKAAKHLIFKDAEIVRPFKSSLPTSIRWARTAREGDRIRAYAKTAPDGLFTLRPGQLVLRRNGANKPYSFFRNGRDGAKLWIAPDMELHDQPRSLHRYPVAILTSTSKGQGRSFDIYRDAWLLTSEDLADVDADTRLQPVTGARLAEIQVPARPLAYGPPTIPAPYRRLYVDLVALGAQKSAGFRFHIRFVRKRADANGGGGVKLRLVALLGSEPHKVVIDAPFKDAAIFALDLFAHRQGDELRLFWRPRHWDGQVSAVIKGPILDGVDKETGIEGFYLEMLEATATPALSELWADVSMLPCRDFDPAKPDRFDFDWLFSADGDVDIRNATRAPALNEMVEVAAQLVAWSSPIGVAPE
ncbi:hypothetical protein QBK99_05595 [Corticibacterium sp. UT-5YL-CI-8]|nr:hypothetical protein [Tianweitania sp. UT-5YL-CI-8]